MCTRRLGVFVILGEVGNTQCLCCVAVVGIAPALLDLIYPNKNSYGLFMYEMEIHG